MGTWSSEKGLESHGRLANPRGFTVSCCFWVPFHGEDASSDAENPFDAMLDVPFFTERLKVLHGSFKSLLSHTLCQKSD